MENTIPALKARLGYLDEELQAAPPNPVYTPILHFKVQLGPTDFPMRLL